MNNKIALLVVVMLACSKQAANVDSLALDKQPFSNVLDEHLATASTWPKMSISRAEEILDILDTAELGGQSGQRAQRRIGKLSSDELQHALLSIVETEKLDHLKRRLAYSFLAETDWRGNRRFIPRLVLRLKYEKDWPANILIASALAKHNNLAGLDAVVSILRTEQQSQITDLEFARELAAKLIASLNQGNADFEQNWQHALRLKQQWDQQGHPLDSENDVADTTYTDELWHTVAKFRSQPLRPVDDARFVFIRLDNAALKILALAASDSDPYVRDHALQTFSWMEREHDAIPNDDVLKLETDYYSSVRALEYRGSLANSSQAEFLWPFILHGNYEQQTAAADSLLRCSDTSPDNINAIIIDERFSPEAQCSLMLLRDELNGKDITKPVVNGLDKNELARRIKWRESR